MTDFWVAFVLFALVGVADAQQNVINMNAQPGQLDVSFRIYGPVETQPAMDWPGFKIGTLRQSPQGVAFLVYADNGRYKWAHWHEAGRMVVADRPRASGQVQIKAFKHGPASDPIQHLPLTWTRQFKSRDLGGGQYEFSGAFRLYR